MSLKLRNFITSTNQNICGIFGNRRKIWRDYDRVDAFQRTKPKQSRKSCKRSNCSYSLQTITDPTTICAGQTSLKLQVHKIIPSPTLSCVEQISYCTSSECFCFIGSHGSTSSDIWPLTHQPLERTYKIFFFDRFTFWDHRSSQPERQTKLASLR